MWPRRSGGAVFWRSKSRAADAPPDAYQAGLSAVTVFDDPADPMEQSEPLPLSPSAQAPPPTAAISAQDPSPLKVQGTLTAARTDESNAPAYALGLIVSLLLRSEAARSQPLAALDSMVIPAIAAGTYAIAPAQQTGALPPSAVVIWASVTPRIDRLLAEGRIALEQLTPQDWSCGDIVWIAQTAGEASAVANLLDHLAQTRFLGRTVRTRMRGPIAAE